MFFLPFPFYTPLLLLHSFLEWNYFLYIFMELFLILIKCIDRLRIAHILIGVCEKYDASTKIASKLLWRTCNSTLRAGGQNNTEYIEQITPNRSRKAFDQNWHILSICVIIYFSRWTYRTNNTQPFSKCI